MCKGATVSLWRSAVYTRFSSPQAGVYTYVCETNLLKTSLLAQANWRAALACFMGHKANFIMICTACTVVVRLGKSSVLHIEFLESVVPPRCTLVDMYLKLHFTNT